MELSLGPWQQVPQQKGSPGCGYDLHPQILETSIKKTQGESQKEHKRMEGGWRHEGTSDA